MNRRGYLRLLALLAPAGCLETTPGPTGPRTPPTAANANPQAPPTSSALRVKSFDFEETDDGTLRVFGVIENSSDREREAKVNVTVTEQDSRHVGGTTITVDPNSEAEFGIRFDIDYESFARDGEVSVTVE
ncbi:MAG: transcriptional initiation protein Tat [Halobacteriota archaeon]